MLRQQTRPSIAQSQGQERVPERQRSWLGPRIRCTLAIDFYSLTLTLSLSADSYTHFPGQRELSSGVRIGSTRLTMSHGEDEVDASTG